MFDMKKRANGACVACELKLKNGAVTTFTLDGQRYEIGDRAVAQVFRDDEADRCWAVIWPDGRDVDAILYGPHSATNTTDPEVLAFVRAITQEPPPVVE